MSAMPTFFEEHREMQELAREWNIVRQHNLQCAEQGTLGNLLFLAEGLLVLTSFERFFRIIVPNARDNETLYNLMQRANRLRLVTMPHDSQQEAIRIIGSLRNQLVHANYEQAAREAGYSTIREYFGSSQYAGTVERLTLLLDNIMAQIDPCTGRPYGTREQTNTTAD